MALVRGNSPIPIAADESCRTVVDLDAILKAKAADAVVVKPMASGLREAVLMVARARGRWLPIIVTTMFDAGIGTVVATHLAALTGPRPLACGLGTLDHLENSLTQQVPAIVRGTVSLGGAPGLGLKIDRAALRRYATGPVRDVSA
jgi:L-alanine-DL-glutamate epimerase-like enolase superfamily enzyme